MTVSRTMMIAAAAMTLAACGERRAGGRRCQRERQRLGDDRHVCGEPHAARHGRRLGAGQCARSPATRIPLPAAAIPAALHGRWGLTPGDCTSTRGDAKGLLTIGADELRFYESRAVPAAKLETSADTISGDFAFTGEGQSWARYQALELQKDRLVRTERDPTDSFSYVRCD